MTTRAKMHTIELTENELARVLFVMRNVNGETHGKSATSSALDKLGANEIEFEVFHAKAMELAKRANIPSFLNYYEVQREWESFLGVVGMDRSTLEKIAKLESELARLKGVL